MPEVRFPPDPDSLNETPVITVTSLRLRERPHLSLRQRRIAEFVTDRKQRKDRRGRRKRTDRTLSAAVTTTGFCRVWNPYLLDLAMEQHEEKTPPQDDVKVLFPARDILYSDSEVAILSSRSTWGFGNDPPPSIISTRSAVCVDEKTSPRPCSRIGVIDGTAVGDRYHNKPEGCLLSNDVFGIADKPYRQPWRSLWEHQVVEVKPAKTSNGSLEQVASNAKSPRNVEDKQRSGEFHTMSSNLTNRSKISNRPLGRPVHQRSPSAKSRSAQRKLSAMRDELLKGDCERFVERMPRMRRCEPPRRKQGVPRVVVTTASRPMTAISMEKLDVPSGMQPRSAPENPKPATSEHFNNRMGRLSTAGPLARPRFSVPIKASRVPMDLLFKEMSCPKPHYSRRDLNAAGGPPVKYRGQHRVADVPFHDLSQDTVFFRDTGQTAHFNLPERSRLATLRSNRRMFNRPTLETRDSNPYSTSFQIDAECMPIPKNLTSTDGPSPLSEARTALMPPGTDRSMERRPLMKLNSANLSVLTHFYGRTAASRQSSAKCNYSEADGHTHPGSRFPIPALYQNDLPVPPHHLYDSHALPNQTAQTYHFSHNAPDVLISPPPTSRHRGDTLRVPGGSLEVEHTPVTVCNNHYIPTANFVPRYFDPRSHDATLDDDRIVPEPFLPPHLAPRAFMPSVDFSRTGSPPRPHPDGFSYVRADGHENLLSAHAGRPQYPMNFQQSGVQAPFPTANQEENASKTTKTLLTFGAQVPSSERIPLSSLVSGYLSSPRVETEAKFSEKQDQINPAVYPSSPPVVPAEATKPKDIISKPDSVTASTNIKPILQGSESSVGNRVACAYNPNLNTTSKGKDKDGPVSKTEEKVENVSTGNLSPTNEGTDRSRPIKTCASLLDCISSEYLNLPDTTTRQFGLTRTRSLRLCTHSDTKLSTVTEKSSDTLQAAESPLQNDPPETGGLKFDLPSPRAEVAARIPEAEPELRFQLVESKNVEGPRKEPKDPEAVVMKCKPAELVDNPPNIHNRAQSPEMFRGDVSITEICDDDPSALNDSPNERFRPESDLRSSCTDSTTYRVSASYRYTNGKSSFTESGASCLDALDDSRVSSLLQSVNSSNVRQRFQSAVSHLGARRHIALQCKLAEKSTTESALSDSKSIPMSISLEPQVVRKDVCIQVPVVCCQSVGTERYTTEKGVPECRAGLTLRLMSTVVDVPPVVKVTEHVGISTEDMTDDEGNPAMEECESKIPREVICSIEDDFAGPTSFENCVDCRRSLVNVKTSPRRLRRLKPFFRSHCGEFSNICTLAAVPLNTENGWSPRQKLASESNKHRGSNDDWKDEQQLPHDRWAAFRSNKTVRQADASCVHHKDKHSDHHRTADLPKRCSDKKDPPTANDQQTRRAKSSSRRTADSPDQKHPRNIGGEEKTGCRRKVGESSIIARPSSGNEDFENKQRPSCAVCKKEHIYSSQKKTTSKRKNSGGKTPDIRSSIIKFGLSNIVTPAEKSGPPPVEHREQSNVTHNDEKFHRQSSRSDLECRKSHAFETPKRSEPLESGKAFRIKGDICVNYASTPVVLVRDSIAFNKSRKDFNREIFGNTDSESDANVHESKQTSGSSRSTVPTIFLTRAENNDVPGLVGTSTFAPPVQVAFTSIATTIKDFSVISSKVEDGCNRVPLKESNPAVDVAVKQPAPTSVETRVKNFKDVSENNTSAAGVPKLLDDITVDTLSMGLPEQVETTVKEHLQEDSSNPEFDISSPDQQISSPKLDAKVSAESEQSGSFDSDHSPEPSTGCVYTAMRRYMKFHQRPERIAGSAYWNKCPGFRFTGVPVRQNDSTHRRNYRDCCKCTLADPDSSPGTFEEVTRTPQGRGSISSPQKRNSIGESEGSSKVSEINQTQKPIGDLTHGSSLNTKILWQNAFKKHQPTFQPAKNDSMFQFLPRDSSKRILDIVSSLKYVKEVCCCESAEKKEDLDTPIEAIRSLPPDMAGLETFRIRYPRCPLALPESSHCARRRSSRASSAPGEVRIRHSRCWSPDHTSLRRHSQNLPGSPVDSHHRTATRHRILSWDDEAFVVDDEEDEDKHYFFCYR